MVLKLYLCLGKFNKVPVIMGANENEGLLIKVTIYIYCSGATIQVLILI